MFTERLPPAVREACLDRHVLDDRITPAHIERATEVLRVMGVRARDRAEAALSRVVDMGVAVVDARGPRRHARTRTSPVGRYDLSLVNADVDLASLVGALEKRPAVTACLHGPPGTGKTAFVAHVAERLERPLRVERASDLLGCYVGETEKNIARMFRRAAMDKSVLLLDEADSFFRDRTLARQAWEVTQVNELLTQMDDHDGVFFCATNIFDAFDPASLRRFTLKIAFRPLRLDQRLRIFAAVVPEGADAVAEDLAALPWLTPGDFATAARRLGLTRETFAAPDLLAALRDECALRRGGSASPVGFRVARA